MAEQKKESSSVDSKDGSSSLDDGIGKEFLSSWKSISMADDDPMDFSFDSVSKGKNKKFNFDKLDMDFNLDGELDKISSFKVDMSDLDFSCSPKKSTKSKESKGGKSSDAKEKKRDSFDFNFDFNELDTFNLDSSLKKGDTTSTTKLNKKVVSDVSDLEGAKEPKPSDDEHVHASNDNMALKPLASEAVDTSKVEIREDNERDLGSKQEGSVSKVSSDAKEKKRDSFDFNFDFNELDTFNLDSSLKKGDTTSTTKLNKKVVSDVSDLEGAKEPKPNDDEHVHASNDNMALKPLASEAVDTLKAEIREDNERDLGSKQEGSVSKVSSSGKPDMLIEARTNLGINKTLRPVEKDLERELFLKTTSSKSNSQDINNPPQSFELNCSDQDTISDQHAEAHSPENSSPRQINKLGRSDKEATEFGSSTQAKATNDPQPVKSCASFDKNTKTDLLKKTSHDKDIKEKQSSTLDDHLATTSSDPIVDKVMLIKDKEIEGVHSKFFRKPEDSVHLKHNLLTAGTKDVSFVCKEIGNMQLGPITKARESFKSNDSECGTKLINDSTPASIEPMRDEEGFVSDGDLRGGKFSGNSHQILKNVEKSHTMLPETDMSSGEVNMQSSQFNPSSLTAKTARHATQITLKLQAHNSDKEFFQNLKTIAEKNKLPSVKAAKITPALSSLKTLKSIGTSKLLPTSLCQKETNPSLNSEHMEIQGITASKNGHLIGGAENQKPSAPFLKRKTDEVPEADLVPLRPLKRLSQPPSISRSSKECPEKVVKQVESTNSLLCNGPTFGLQSPLEINLMEGKLPASVVVEDNSNVEKADSYTKELEDIYNLLKKKHEEAKELIVRAVVNNNNLLMLNHPIYEQKIRKVQKFSLQLMSNKIQT